MTEVTVRNVSNFEPDVGAPTLLAVGDVATVERTPEVDDYINIGVLVIEEPEATLDDYSVDELKEVAKELGLPVSGTKPELIERIEAHNSQQGGDA